MGFCIAAIAGMVERGKQALKDSLRRYKLASFKLYGLCIRLHIISSIEFEYGFLQLKKAMSILNQIPLTLWMCLARSTILLE
jgi:hypothetical protein